MDYTLFINKEIINKNNIKGIVISFDKEHIVIRYESDEKTYNPDIAFKSKFLSFVDDSLNTLIEENLFNKEQEQIQKEVTAKDNRRKAVNRTKKVREMYTKLERKNRMMMSLFGRDFLYPPYIEFKKKYIGLINS